MPATDPGTSEAAAYIVQAAFLESRGKGPPISVDTYAAVLREAFAMLGHSRKGETLTQVELAPLRAAIVVDYKRRLSKTYTGKEILKLGMGV